MAMKTEMVKVTYTFKVRYEHDEHLADIKRGLKDNPARELTGAGVIGNEAYSYSCQRIGKGKVEQ